MASKSKTKSSKRNLVNHVVFVLDNSGSMSSLRDSAMKFYNSLIKVNKERAKVSGQETYVSLIKFSDKVKAEFTGQDVNFVMPMMHYGNGGMTALLDAAAAAINLYPPGSLGQEESVAIVIVTDGCENASVNYSPYGFKQLLNKADKDGRYTVTFQVPHDIGQSYKNALHSSFGIPLENILEWETTKEGMERSTQQTTAAFTNYYAARSAGKKSVRNFYADMSNVKTKDVKSKLDDVSGNFKVIKVDKDAAVKDFVEEKSKKEYVIGSAYYQLTKSEKVQPQKQLLVMKKFGKEVYAGNEARDLIGLPHGEEVKVIPGNLGDWDCFIQSTSVNRRLVRGSRLLLDKTLVKGLTPTWA